MGKSMSSAPRSPQGARRADVRPERADAQTDARPGIPAEVCAVIGAPALVLGVALLRADVQALFTGWGVALALCGAVFSLLALLQVLGLCE